MESIFNINNNFNRLNRNLWVGQLKVKKAHLKFNLEEFMRGKGLSDGAVILITSSQFVMVDCLNLDSDYGYHCYAVDVIYWAIYRRIKRVNFEYSPDWQNSVINDGNICIQLCSGFTNFISLPDVISLEQYNALVWFFNIVGGITLGDEEYFEENYVDFFLAYGIEKELIYDLGNIDSMLAVIRERIGNVKVVNETIVGDDIKKLGSDLKYGTLVKRRVKK